MPAMSSLDVEKYSQRPSRDQPSSWSIPSLNVSRFKFTGSKSQDVDVAIAGASRYKREALAIW